MRHVLCRCDPARTVMERRLRRAAVSRVATPRSRDRSSAEPAARHRGRGAGIPVRTHHGPDRLPMWSTTDVDPTPHRPHRNRRRRGGSRARRTVPGVRRRARRRARRPGLPRPAALPDERDGVVRLHLPEGFRYRSFHDTTRPVSSTTARPCPAATTAWPPSRVRTGASPSCATTRSTHPARPSALSVTTPTTPWRRAGAPSSTPRSPVRSRRPGPGINGTQMNCSGGPMPWGTWITCEETVNGPDVGADFTNVSNVPLTKPHGFVFEVPTTGRSDAEPVTNAGRFAHESVAFDPRGGSLYLSEDNFGFPSGFYRYTPRTSPMETGRLDNDGRLQMLKVKGVDEAHLEASQAKGARYHVEWVDIDDPAPSFPYTPGQPAPTTNNDALVYVGDQGRDQGAAHFSTARGDDLRQRGRLLHLDPGRWRGDDRPQHGHRLRQRLRPGLGLRHPVRDAVPRLPVAQPRRPRLPGQHHGEPPRHARSCARTTSTTTTCAVSPAAASCGTSPSTGSPDAPTTSSPARPSAPTGTPSSSTSRPVAACPSRSGARGSASASDEGSAPSRSRVENTPSPTEGRRRVLYSRTRGRLVARPSRVLRLLAARATASTRRAVACRVDGGLGVGHGHPRHGVVVVVEHRDGDRPEPGRHEAVLDGVAALPHGLQLRAQLGGRRRPATVALHQCGAVGEQGAHLGGRQGGQHRQSGCREHRRQPHPHVGDQQRTARRALLDDVEHVAPVQHREVRVVAGRRRRAGPSPPRAIRSSGAWRW